MNTASVPAFIVSLVAGASLGTGMLSPGLTNGLGLGLGQTGRRGEIF